MESDGQIDLSGLVNQEINKMLVYDDLYTFMATQAGGTEVLSVYSDLIKQRDSSKTELRIHHETLYLKKVVTSKM